MAYLRNSELPSATSYSKNRQKTTLLLIMLFKLGGLALLVAAELTQAASLAIYDTQDCNLGSATTSTTCVAPGEHGCRAKTNNGVQHSVDTPANVCWVLRDPPPSSVFCSYFQDGGNQGPFDCTGQLQTSSSFRLRKIATAMLHMYRANRKGIDEKTQDSAVGTKQRDNMNVRGTAFRHVKEAQALNTGRGGRMWLGA